MKIVKWYKKKKMEAVFAITNVYYDIMQDEDSFPVVRQWSMILHERAVVLCGICLHDWLQYDYDKTSTIKELEKIEKTLRV